MQPRNMLCIFCFAGNRNQYAVHTAVLNFIQDIHEDLANNRLYYPLEDCRKFGIDLKNASHDLTKLSSLSLFELERVEYMLNNGARLAESVQGRLRYELRAIIYAARKMISKVWEIGGDTYSIRPKLSKREHFTILLKSLLLSAN